MAGPEIETIALRRLVDGYARAVDRGDAEAFVELFEPDAILQVFHGSEADGPTTESRGRPALGQIPGRLKARYSRTFHFVGNHMCEVRGDEATGEAYCLAHHLTENAHGGTDYVMLIRYHDDYRRRPGDSWKFAHRRLTVDWTELRTALPPGLAGRPASAIR